MKPNMEGMFKEVLHLLKRLPVAMDRTGWNTKVSTSLESMDTNALAERTRRLRDALPCAEEFDLTDIFIEARLNDLMEMPDCIERRDIIELLVADGMLFFNEIGPEEDRRLAMLLNCNDTFALGGSDCIEIEFSDLFELFEYWRQDRIFGTTIFACKKRDQLPVERLVERIQDGSPFDIHDELGIKPEREMA